jgi:hypothetical protein
MAKRGDDYGTFQLAHRAVFSSERRILTQVICWQEPTIMRCSFGQGKCRKVVSITTMKLTHGSLGPFCRCSPFNACPSQHHSQGGLGSENESGEVAEFLRKSASKRAGFLFNGGRKRRRNWGPCSAVVAADRTSSNPNVNGANLACSSTSVLHASFISLYPTEPIRTSSVHTNICLPRARGSSYSFILPRGLRSWCAC